MSFETPEGWSEWIPDNYSGGLLQAPSAELANGDIKLFSWELNGRVARFDWSPVDGLSATGAGEEGTLTSKLGIADGDVRGIFGRSPFGTPQKLTEDRRSIDLDWEVVASNGPSSAMLGGPAAVAYGPDRLDLFFVRPDSSLCRLPVEPEVEPETTLGFGFQGTPAACTWAGKTGDELQVFVRGVDNALWHFFSNDGRWFSRRLGGVVAGGPSLASWGPGRLDCFVLNGDGSISDWWWDGGAFQGRWDFPGSFLSAPTALAPEPSRLYLWAVTFAGQLFHCEFGVGSTEGPIDPPWAGWQLPVGLGGLLGFPLGLELGQRIPAPPEDDLVGIPTPPDPREGGDDYPGHLSGGGGDDNPVGPSRLGTGGGSQPLFRPSPIRT